MGHRKEALWRVVAIVYAWFVASLVASIAILIGLVWGAIDVIYQLIMGSDGLSSNSSTADYLKRVIMWPVQLTVFAITGDGEMQWLP